MNGYGLDCIVDYLEEDNLLQVLVQVGRGGGGGFPMTWSAYWRLWEEKSAFSCEIVSREGRLDLRDLNVLKRNFPGRGVATTLVALG